jgi:hypothetical protein
MKTYYIDFYKTSNLRPDELNAMRRNQYGIWLSTGVSYYAKNARDAITQAKRDPQPALGVGRYKLRARLK